MFSKLESCLFLLLLLFLPSQLSLHLWPSWSFVNSLPIDYLSPTLYLTDIIIFLLVIPYFFRSIRSIRSIKLKHILLFVFALANISISISPLVTLYKWLRLLEYYLLYKSLLNFKHLSLNLSLPLSLSIIWASLLAWWQVLLQKNVGGLWYWLGERPLSLTQIGVAKIQLLDLGLRLRPYSVFPHPNALAGFLLVGGLILYFFYTSPLRPSPRLGEGFRERGIELLAIVSTLITIPLTFSRTAIILEILILSLWLTVKSKINIAMKLSALVLSFAFCILSLYIGNPSSLSERFALIQKSLIVIHKSPLLGIGLGTFPSYQLSHPSYQPVHNIFLLLASELGLPGFFILSLIVIKSLSHSLWASNSALKIAIFSIVLISLVDHYWITSHQNILLVLILLVMFKIQSVTCK